MIATERTVERLIARLDHAVAMLCTVRADDSAPAVGVGLAKDKPLAVKPCQDVIKASVADADSLIVGSVALLWRDAKRLANVVQRVFTLWIERHQPRSKVVAALLQVDRAGDATVANRIGRARVGIASLCDSLNRSGKVAFGWLVGKSVTPLERSGACFQHPCRRKRRLFGLCANVVQHHKQNVIDVAALGGWPTFVKAVNDERACVDIPRLAFLNLCLVRQEGREGRGGHAIGMINHVAVSVIARLLAQQQGSLAHLCRQASHIINKF